MKTLVRHNMRLCLGLTLTMLITMIIQQYRRIIMHYRYVHNKVLLQLSLILQPKYLHSSPVHSLPLRQQDACLLLRLCFTAGLKATLPFAVSAHKTSFWGQDTCRLFILEEIKFLNNFSHFHWTYWKILPVTSAGNSTKLKCVVVFVLMYRICCVCQDNSAAPQHFN